LDEKRQCRASDVNLVGLLQASELPAYLRELGVAPATAEVRARTLGGGVSNVVLLAEWEGGGVVVKQPLAELAVEDVWAFDRDRIFVERDCMALIAERMPGSAPEVVFSDEDRFVFGMTVAPPGGVVWRDEHDSGEADPARTELAAELLGRMHALTAGDPGVAERFGASWPLIQGRVDPYHRTVAAAHPDLADRIEAEVQRLLATRRCLVHGDYSPKNLIAYPDRMLMLDFEVAHWGDPAFDVAFLLALVMLDGIRHGASAFAAEGRRFWRVYRAAAGATAAEEAAVVAELGCIVLARVDGKSRLPLEPAVQERGRAYGRHLLNDLPSLEEALTV
jgi:aminoglycoside phosphotransferase (APT) family kinase protein